MKLVLLVTLLFLRPAFIGHTANLVLKVTDKEAPAELDASLRAKLQKQTVQLLDGDKPAFEFWFAADVALPVKPASPGKSLDTIKPATLLGAAVVAKGQRDYRDDELTPGVYTLRFALQPQDGNHLGTAEFAYFAVLVPAKLDTSPDGIGDYKALIKASSKLTSTEHPVVLSLRPATDGGDAPRLNEPAPEHKSVRVKLPVKITGSDEKTSLAFELVYQGVGKK